MLILGTKINLKVKNKNKESDCSEVIKVKIQKVQAMTLHTKHSLLSYLPVMAQ